MTMLWILQKKIFQKHTTDLSNLKAQSTIQESKNKCYIHFWQTFSSWELIGSGDLLVEKGVYCEIRKHEKY